MYFLKEIKEQSQLAQLVYRQYPKSQKLVLGSLFACMAAVLQSAGGILPGMGYLISPFATLPILFCTILSFPMGIMTFILTIPLLLFIQPSELFVFSFTTGLVGVSIGAGFHFFKKRLSIISIGAIMLTIGIISLLYLFQFPILGPVASDDPSWILTIGIILFSFLYSWLWVEFSLLVLNRLMAIIFS